MNIKTKLVTALTLAVLVVPGISLAQTQSVTTLQQEIASLAAQLQSLESQLTAAGGSTVAWCYAFDTNLSIGMSGADVTALQTALQKDGESVTVNGTFDDQTAAAVTAFQQKYQSTILAPYGLNNGTGYAGKSTRAELNILYGCGTTKTITTLPTTTQTTATYPTGCTSSSGYSSTDGESCAPATTTPPVTPTPPAPVYPTGCTSFSGYSSTDGESCGSSASVPTTTQTIATYPTGCTSLSGYSSTDGESCGSIN